MHIVVQFDVFSSIKSVCLFVQLESENRKKCHQGSIKQDPGMGVGSRLKCYWVYAALIERNTLQNLCGSA